MAGQFDEKAIFDVARQIDSGDARIAYLKQVCGDDEQLRQKNLSVFKAWVGEDAWTLKRWKTRGGVPGVTKEEIARMKLKY